MPNQWTKKKDAAAARAAKKADKAKRTPRTQASAKSDDVGGSRIVVYARIDPATHAWLSGLVHDFGMRESELIRRALEDARVGGWDPVASLQRARDAAKAPQGDRF